MEATCYKVSKVSKIAAEQARADAAGLTVLLLTSYTEKMMVIDQPKPHSKQLLPEEGAPASRPGVPRGGGEPLISEELSSFLSLTLLSLRGE